MDTVNWGTVVEGLIITAAAATAGLAYNNPKGYARLYRLVGYLVAVAAIGIVIFGFAVSRFHLAIFAGVAGYALFLYMLPHIVGRREDHGGKKAD